MERLCLYLFLIVNLVGYLADLKKGITVSTIVYKNMFKVPISVAPTWFSMHLFSFFSIFNMFEPFLQLSFQYVKFLLIL